MAPYLTVSGREQSLRPNVVTAPLAEGGCMFKCRASPYSLTSMAFGCLLVMLSGSGSIAAEASGPVDLFTLCLASLPEARPEGIGAAWSFAPVIIVPLALATVLYAR